MTFKEFCTKKEIVINNFRKNKWKAEDGSFSYPRGKRTIDALKDVIDIVFGENELKIEKEMTVRGDGVVGTILLAAVYFEENDKKLLKYITFTVTDRLFALNSFDNPTTALIAGNILVQNQPQLLLIQLTIMQMIHQKQEWS